MQHTEMGRAQSPVDKPFVDPACGMHVAANPHKWVRHDGQDY